MEPSLDPSRFDPPLRLLGGDGMQDIATLDEALAFAEQNPRPAGDYEGMIRRLQGAHRAEDLVSAADAFRWWAESNDLLAPSVPVR